MTNEEAKEFLDNLKICINEHPIVADWLVEIADRKTENCSEKPNNCEHITEDGVTCAKYPACDYCLDNPLNKVKGSERLLKGKVEPTISKMEQVDKDINVRSKDCETCKHYKLACELFSEICKYEPTTQTETQNSNLTLTEGVWNAGYKTGYDKGYKDAQKVKDSQDLVKDLVKAFCEDGTWLERQGVYTLTLAEAKQRAVDIIESILPKDEPQTDIHDLTDCDFCKDRNCKDCEGGKDEPQWTKENCKGCKYNEYPYDSGTCFVRVCINGNKYEPKDEPQTERSE